MNWYSNNYIIITTFIIHYHNNYYHALLSLFIINTQFVTYIDMDARLRLVRKGIQEIYDVSATNTWFQDTKLNELLYDNIQREKGFMKRNTCSFKFFWFLLFGQQYNAQLKIVPDIIETTNSTMQIAILQSTLCYCTLIPVSIQEIATNRSPSPTSTVLMHSQSLIM